MKAPRLGKIKAWFLIVCFPLALMACSSATYLTAKVSSNPIPAVSQKAQDDWSVTHVNNNTIELSDAWVTYSILALGYGNSYAKLYYDQTKSELHMQYYFRCFPLITLWMPSYLDAEPGMVGGALKPVMNDQINDILRMGGATTISRRAGSRSEQFPATSGQQP